MTFVTPRRATVAALTCLALLATSLPARAGIINGDFSQGLSGWQVSDSNFVSVVNGQAALSEVDPSISLAFETDLYQDFQIPVGAKSVSFMLVGSGFDPAASYFIPPAFGASLLDPASGVSAFDFSNPPSSLVDTVDSSTDSFVTQDIAPSGEPVRVADGVTPTLLPGGLLVTLDLPDSLDGTDARLLFRLIGGDSYTGASVTISNVTLDVGTVNPPPAVPAPPAAVLGLVGAACAFGYRRLGLRSRQAGVGMR